MLLFFTFSNHIPLTTGILLMERASMRYTEHQRQWNWNGELIIHSFSVYLLSISHILDTEPCIENLVINKIETCLHFKGIYDLMKDNKKIQGSSATPPNPMDSLWQVTTFISAFSYQNKRNVLFGSGRDFISITFSFPDVQNSAL